jgi:hypothetical protein
MAKSNMQSREAVMKELDRLVEQRVQVYFNGRSAKNYDEQLDRLEGAIKALQWVCHLDPGYYDFPEN